MRAACVLLAAGASKRFGANKLFYELGGQTLLERTLRLHGCLPYAQKLLVTRRDYGRAASLADAYGFTTLYNGNPERGMGSSAAIGARKLIESGADNALFAVCDQPYLKPESVEKLLGTAAAHPESIVSAAHGGRRGNPCVFPASLFFELALLDGERGGSAVIERHADRLMLVDIADASELWDIDVPPEEDV